MGYLLDTNILSARFKPSYAVDADIPSVAIARLEEKMNRHRAELFTPATVIHELRYGVARLPNGRRKKVMEGDFRRIISVLQILPYDNEAALWHAEQRAKLERAGITPPFVDGQIAAVCVVHGHVLVTDNERHFRHFDDLQVENWLRPSRRGRRR